MHQRTGAQLRGKQGGLGALTTGIVAGACSLPAPALAAPASPALAGAVSSIPAGGGSAGHAGICFLPCTCRPGEPPIPAQEE
jgi:hypothetical protein